MKIKLLLTAYFKLLTSKEINIVVFSEEAIAELRENEGEEGTVKESMTYNVYASYVTLDLTAQSMYTVQESKWM